MLRFGQVLFSAEERSDEYTCLSAARGRIAVGTSLGAVHIYAVTVCDYAPRLELLARSEPPVTDSFLRTRVTCVKLSPCATYLAVGTKNGTVTVFSIKRDRGVIALSVELQHNEHRGRNITAFAWSAQSDRLYSGCEGGRLFEAVVASKAKGRLIDSFRLAGSFFGISNVTEIPDKTSRGVICKLEYATVQAGVRAVDCATEVLVVAGTNYVTLYGFTGDSEMRPMQKVQASDSKIDSVALHQVADETNRMYCKGLYISQPGGVLCYFSLDATTLSSMQLRATPQLHVHERDLWFVDLTFFPDVAGGNGLLSRTATGKMVVIDTANSLFEIPSDFEHTEGLAETVGYVFVLHGGPHGQQISALQFIIPSEVRREPNNLTGTQVIYAIIHLQRLFRGKQLRKRILAEIRKKESALSPQQVLTWKLSKLDEELGTALIAREAHLEEIIFDQASQSFGLPQRANGLSRFTSMDTDAGEDVLPEVDKCVSVTNRFLRSCDQKRRLDCTSDDMLQCCDDILAASRRLLRTLEAEASEAEDETTSSNTDDEGPAAAHRGRYSEGAADMYFPMNGYTNFAEAAEAMVAITQLVLASSYQTVVVNDSRAAHLLGEDDELLHWHERGGHTPTKQYSGSVRAMLDGVTNVLTHSKKITQTVNKKMFELIEGVKEGIHAAHSRSTDNLQALLNGDDLVDQDTAQAPPPPEGGDTFVRYEPMPQPDDEMLANIRARRHRAHASRFAGAADIGDIADDGVSHLPPNQYEVVLLAPRGIGLNLAILGRDLVVRDFNTLDNGETAPAEQSGVIEIGDILVGVNGLDLRQLPLDDTVDLLQRMNEIATEPITLRFMYADAVRNDAEEDDFLLGMFEAMTAPTELRAMQYLHNGARSALLDTVDEAELELRRRRHAARNVDHAAAFPKEVTQESSYRPTRASMVECIEDMKAQVRELKRAQVSGWFDNEHFSRLLRDQKTRASELRHAETDSTVDTRVYIPPLSLSQAAAMRAALYSRASTTELAVATPRRTPLDRLHYERESGYDSQGYLIWFDQAAPQDRIPEDVVVDVTGPVPSQHVPWDRLDPILQEEDEGEEEKDVDALDADALVSQLSNDLVDQLGAVMAGESRANLASTVLPPIQLTCQLTELLAVQSSLTNAATEIDQLLQMWLRCFTPLPYSKRNSLLDEVQAACSLSVFDAQQHTEMARDLVTIYFCLHTAWRWLDAGNKGKSERGTNGGADITARVQRVCRLALIDLQILWEPCSDSGKLPAPVQWSHAEASRFIAQYGAYLHLDPVCVACNARRFSDSLEVAMQVAACDASWQSASTKLGQLAKDGAAVVGARALLTALAEPNKYAFNLYVSSLLLHLGTLYRKDDQLATEVCVLMFPAIRPWNVKWALVGNLAQRLLSPPSSSAEDELDDAMREWLWVARRKYHQYLNVLMRSRTDTIGLSWEIVHQWLEVSLILATAEPSAPETPSAAHRARKFIVSSRHILKHQLQYKYRARDAIECCRRYRFAEGILEACKQSLTYQSEQSNLAEGALPADRLLPVEEMSGVVTDTIDKLLRHEFPQDGRLWTDISTGVRLLWAVALHSTATEADAMSWLVEQLAALISDHAQRAAQHDEPAKRICNNFAQALAQALGPSRAIACAGRVPGLLAVLERSFFATCCDLSVV